MGRTEIRYEPYDVDSWVELKDGSHAPASFALAYCPDAGETEPAWVAEFHVREGVPECRQVVVTATPEGREIATADLRRLRIDDLVDAAVTQVAGRQVTDADGRVQVVREVRSRVRPARPARSARAARSAGSGRSQEASGERRARRTITDEVLAEVAEVYRAHLEHNPTAAVAEHFGLGSDRTARLYVRRARTAGYLGKATPGKAGERP